MPNYDGLHRRLRTWWAPRVKTGAIVCPRYGHPLFPDCPGPIAAHADWDLGHDDTNPTEWTGPEHRTCNRRAGALKQQGQLTRSEITTSEEW